MKEIKNEVIDRTKPPLGTEPKDVKFPEFFDIMLPNGTNLIVIENHKIPLVTVRLVFTNAGSYNDGEKFGLASLTSEMLMKGTKQRTALQIADDIDYLGGVLSTASDWDGSYITLSVLKKHLQKGIEILTDVLLNPVFEHSELERLRMQRLSSILMNKDEPSNLSEKRFNKTIYRNLPYANPQEGTEESIKNLNTNDLKEFYCNNYLSNNLIIAFVGDITSEEALKTCEDNFINLRSNFNHSVNIGKMSEDKSLTKVYIVNKADAVQSNLKIGHIGISRNNPDYLKVLVMNTLVGGYFGSRINYTLREKYGYTYGARTSFSCYLYSGDFSADTDVRNEVTDKSVSIIIDELQRITSEEVTDEEMQTVKNYLTGTFSLQLETANQIAAKVILLKLYNLPKDYYSKYISNIKAITKLDILETARKYIKPEELKIIVSGDYKKIKDKLLNFGEVKIYDAYDNIIE